MGVIRLADGSFRRLVPAYRTLINRKLGSSTTKVRRISGLKPDAKLDVSWDGKVQCTVTVPEKLTGLNQNGNLLLPCQ
jgi:hypothetical protein